MKFLSMLLVAVVFMSGCLVPAKPTMNQDYVKGKESIFVDGSTVLALKIKRALLSNKAKIVDIKDESKHVLTIASQSAGTAISSTGVGEAYSFDITLVDKESSKTLMLFSGTELEKDIIKEVVSALSYSVGERLVNSY